MRGFNSVVYNVFHFVNEVLIGIYHAVILVSLLEGTADRSKKLTGICMNIIIVAWVLNIVISMINTIMAVVGKIKELLKKRRLKQSENKYKTQTAPEPSEGPFKISEFN